MTRASLDWKYFDWREFQTLCIAIAEMIVPDCNFSEHLRPGQKQDGIDLVSFRRKGDKLFSIQCKKEESLTEGDLKKIVKTFKEGLYFDKSSDFIIATSADLQNRDLQNFIHTTQIELKNECDLFFDCWDISNIGTLLRKRWDLVSKYFGKLQADEFCYPQARYDSLQEIEPVPHYIPRRIIQFAAKKNSNDSYWNFSPIKTFSLIELITTNRDKADRICIVADAYQGKSSYIKQCILELKQGQFHLQPVFIQIKDYNVQPIDQLLKTLFGEWQTIPLRDLLLVIDGLDEVPTEKFAEMISHIKEFSTAYQPVPIIFSCRKLFYSKYNVVASLPDFNTYDLYPLQHDDVETYLKSALGSLADQFRSAVGLAGISSFLYHPFFLVNIVEEYLKPPHKLPDSKVKVIDSLIDRSFDFTRYRKIKGSESVNNESVRFKDVIEQFAFALQLAGINSFTNDDVQQIFSIDDRLLLQHNSLVTNSENSWGFVNALFQEHIAANRLSRMSFENIVELCTVGSTIKKIKTKWIQTISSLISILDPNSELFQKIFRLIEGDNIELLFQTESSKYDDDLKLSLLKNLIYKCVQQNIRALIIYEDTVGQFIQASSACKNFILEILISEKLTDRIKIVCCSILRYSLLDPEQQTRYLDFCIAELPRISDAFYAGNLIDVLTYHKAGDQKLIEKLISFTKLNDHHEYRDAIYELITVLDLADKFYLYGLKGLPYLIRHNAGTHHGGSETNIERFLLSAKQPANIAHLLRSFIKGGWADYFEKHGLTGQKFFKELFDKLADIFPSYPFVIFAIADLIRDLGRRFLRGDFKEIDAFLEKTQSHWLAVRILIDDIFKDNNWEIGSLITYDSYDYILFEFDHNNYELKHLRSCLGGLRYKHKNEIADGFYKLCVDATEGGIINREAENDHKVYQEAERKKYENDLIYIQSSEAFKEGVVKFFKAYGNDTMPESDVFIDVESNRGKMRQDSDSYFLYYYFTRWHRNQPVIKLSQCLKELSNNEYFEIFRAEEILNYHQRNEATDKVLLPILENYYKENLSSGNFTNCLWTENDRYHWRTKEFRLGEIFKKFAFDTSEDYLIELVWLDSEGIRGFENATLNKRQGVSQMIIERLSNSGKQKFRKKIVENIKSGIQLESVLGTHIGLCRHLKIVDAKEPILEYVKASSNENSYKSDAVDIYLELGGELKNLLTIFSGFQNYNEYFFGFLVSKLYKKFPTEVSVKLAEVTSDEKIDYKNKIKFVQILTELGDVDAFSILVNEVRQKCKSPYSIQGNHTIARIDTAKALELLEDIMYLVVDRKYTSDRSFHDSARNIILEWLNALAAKSENDLKMVTEFLDAARENLKSQYEDAYDMNWYIHRILEDFRNSDKTIKTIKEIKTLLEKLGNN